MARTVTGTNVLTGTAIDNTAASSALAWVRAPGGTNSRIFTLGSSEETDLYFDTGVDRLVFRREMTNGTSWIWQADQAIDLTLWTHVAWIHDGTDNAPKCRINGMPVSVSVQASASGTAAKATAGIVPYLGNTAAATRPFTGSIGELAYYGRQIDDHEVYEHMRGAPALAGLLFYYPLQGGSPEPDRGPLQGSASVTGTTIVRGPALMPPPPSAALLAEVPLILNAAADFTAEVTMTAAAVVTPSLAAATFTASATLTADAYTAGADVAWSGSGWNGRLQLAAYAGIGGPMLADWSGLAQAVKWSANLHGFEALSASIPMAQGQALQWYAPQGLIHLEVNSDGRTVWEGRMEDPAIDDAGFSFTGLGYFSALSDDPYTAVWSDTDIEKWEPVTPADLANHDPSLYEMDNVNRLFIAPRYDEIFNSTNRAGWGYKTPPAGERTINRITFDWRFSGFTTSFRAYLGTYEDGGTITERWSVTGTTTAIQSGTQTVTWSGSKNLVFGYVIDSASDYNYLNTTGIRFLEVINIRVSSNTTPITSSTIAKALATRAAATSPAMLSGTDALIAETGLDLLNESYQDELPADILTRLALLGDNQTPPRQWDIGVWEGRVIRFQPKGTGARSWFADLGNFTTARTMENVINVAYPVYKEAGGRELRGADKTDETSVKRYGVKRRAGITVDTTSSTQANTTRDAFLQDGKDPIPRAGVVVDAIYDSAGARWPLFMVRPGDNLTNRSLPPTLTSGIDQIGTWRIGRVEYDADADLLTIEPEEALPTLGALQARRDEFGDNPGRASFRHVQPAKTKKKKKKKKR